MRIYAVALTLAALACASGPARGPVWTKAGATDLERRADMQDCSKVVMVVHDEVGSRRVAGPDARCMAVAGYEYTPTWYSMRARESYDSRADDLACREGLDFELDVNATAHYNACMNKRGWTRQRP